MHSRNSSRTNRKYFSGEIYRRWLQLRYHYLALSPETVSLLEKLKRHYQLGLITNGPSRAQWEKIQRLDLRSYFDIILVSGDLPWEKPSRYIFDEACEYLGVLPRQCIMVGDKLETDILGGIQAKLGGTVWVPLPNADLNRNDLHPDHVISNVTELPDLLPDASELIQLKKLRESNAGGLFRFSPDFEDYNSNASDGS